MKRERKDSVWVYNIFSTRSSFFYNKYYELILSSWIWWDKKFDFHAASLKNIKESGIFQHNQWLKVNLKGTRYPLYGAGAGLAVPGLWSQWRSSNDFSFWIQFNCVAQYRHALQLHPGHEKGAKNLSHAKITSIKWRMLLWNFFLKVRRLKAKKMGQNSMKGRVNIQKKNKLLRRAWYYSDAAVFFWLSTAQPVSRTVPPILLGGQ